METRAPAPRAAPAGFLKASRALLSADEEQALGKVLWVDRLTSLWAPVTVLGLAFLPYLVIVESSVCTYSWLLTPMQVFGALCFFWWAGLVGSRFALKGYSRARASRTLAEELLADVAAQVKRHRAQLKDRVVEDLSEKSAALWRGFAQGGNATDEAARALDAASAKHLSHLKRSSALDVGSGFVKALLIALAIRTVLVEPFKIPSGSMLPTLEIGDQIFVNKFIYGVRIPFTNFVPFVIVRAPRRGDVIVFNNPVRPDDDYIKRVVGVPGDRIDVVGRVVTLNGKPLEAELESPDAVSWEPPNARIGLVEWLTHPGTWFQNDWREEHAALSREDLDGQKHWVLHKDSLSPARTDIVVPEGHVFVMGDNRDNSLDSRYGLGREDLYETVQFVPYGNIKGKATVIWLALGHGGLLSGIFGGTGVRTDRFFRPVTMCGTEPMRTK